LGREDESRAFRNQLFVAGQCATELCPANLPLNAMRRVLTPFMHAKELNVVDVEQRAPLFNDGPLSRPAGGILLDALISSDT